MIAEVRLQQFRSYKDKTVKLSPGVNIIVGPNASGKTNLLEAIMVICRGSSYRAADSELVMHNKTWARIDANTTYGPRILKLTTKTTSTKQFTLNNKNYSRLSATNQLPVTLFEPNHLLMLSGSPELRRNYLDGILELIKPGFKKARSDYLRTLRQRNSLLKSGRTNSTTLFPWNVRLSHLGGELAVSRANLTIELSKNISGVYGGLSRGKAKINLVYKTKADLDNYESQLLRMLEADLELDLLRGFTASGPHREDLEVLISKRSPSQIASRGEVRSITIALKMLEAEVIHQKLGIKPILLLDDVFSELDTSRRQALAGLIVDQQCLITTTDASYKGLPIKSALIKTVPGVNPG